MADIGADLSHVRQIELPVPLTRRSDREKGSLGAGDPNLGIRGRGDQAGTVRGCDHFRDSGLDDRAQSRSDTLHFQWIWIYTDDFMTARRKTCRSYRTNVT